MPEFGDLTFDPNLFSGVAKLFPLPNLVMFPHVMQPLHVFEPRYRQMVEQAMAADRLIVLAGLAPGWEKDYDGRPPLRRSCLPDADHQLSAPGRRAIQYPGVRAAAGRDCL